MRSFMALVSGASAATAMCLESGAHSKALTPFSILVSLLGLAAIGGHDVELLLAGGRSFSGPGRSERKAIQRPSGDQAASLLDFAAQLSGGAPVATSAIQSSVSKALVSQLVRLCS